MKCAIALSTLVAGVLLGVLPVGAQVTTVPLPGVINPGGTPYTLAPGYPPQINVFPVPGPRFQQLPGAPGTGVPGFNPQFAQRQSGVAPAGLLGLLPGGTRMLAAYCTDLLSDAPNGATTLIPSPGAGEVRFAGYRMPVLEAQQRGLILVRGHDPALDPPRNDDGGWLDLHLVNLTPYNMEVRIDPAMVFTPAGQQPPAIDPQLAALFQAEAQQGLAGSTEASMAVWASRGSNFQDVAEQHFRFFSRQTAVAVQELLDQSGVRSIFNTGAVGYQALYQENLQALGPDASTTALKFALSDGSQARATLTRNTAGAGVVQIFPLGATARAAGPGASLYYNATVKDLPGGKFSVTFFQPRTGDVVPGVPVLSFNKRQ